MRKLFAVPLIVILTGCVATTQDYKYTPTAKLCMDYLTAGPLNFNQNAREKALFERGEDCSAFTGLAAQERATQREQGLKQMQMGHSIMTRGY
jgi:hypothetical protein